MAVHNSRRSSLAIGFAAVAASAIGVPGLPRAAAAEAPIPPATLTLVAPAVASDPSVSGNGQFVVFTAAPSLREDPATNSQVPDGRTSSIWLSDRVTGTVTEITRRRDGTRIGNSVNPVISSDGCTIVVTTEIAYDLFRDDDRGARWDVYRTTSPACSGKPDDWSIVSSALGADGQAQARNDVDPTQPAALSSAGAVVAYVRPMKSLTTSDLPGLPIGAIDVVDLSIPVDDVRRSTPAPGLPTDMPSAGAGYSGQGGPALSADGSTLVFVSDATSNEPVAEWITPKATSVATVVTQVFAWNRADADPFSAVALISAGASGPGDASSADPAVSADASIIAFSSTATNLVGAQPLGGCAVSCAAQIYLLDRDTDGNSRNDEIGLTSMTRLTETAGPGEPAVIGNGASFAPAISADGVSVAFATQASNLLQMQTPGGGEATDGDLLIADLANGNQLRRAFESIEPVAGAHGPPQLSANGRVLVADTLVADRLLGDPTIVGRHIVAATYRPTLSVAALDFGTIAVSIPGPEWLVKVVNLGPGSFSPATVTIDNPAFVITGGSCLGEPAPVKAGTACTVTIILTPAIPGPLSANLTVAETGFDAIVLTAPVKGTGGEPALDALPDFADYGPTVVGQLSRFSQVFEVSNVYLAPTAVASATMSGANPQDFLITSSTCGTELVMNVSCPVEVSFLPTGAGRRTATLNFSTLLGQYTSVLLSGVGEYAPSLLTAAAVEPGRDLGVGGSGFPANTAVVIGWSDGAGRSMTVVTDGSGAFLTNLAITRNQPAGAATLVAQTPDGVSASAAVEIVREQRRAPRQRP